MTDKTPRDPAAEAKAALEKLRSYAAGHSSDITGALDRIGEFVDRQTKGRYTDKIADARESAKRGVGQVLGTDAPAHSAGHPNPFGLDDEPVWTQPPRAARTGGAHAVGGASAKPDLKAALDRLRAFAAAHTDDLGGLVDKVGDFVDAQTKGKYADRVDKAQAAAKNTIDKLKR